jgi:hypothetical protein
MNRNDTIYLLAYIKAADNRNIGDADILFWMETLPGWLDLDTAKAAVRMFFSEPAGKADERIFFTTRHLISCAKRVRKQREVEEAREAAKRPAITQRTTPPKGGWRSLLPEGPPRVTEKHEVRTGFNYGEALKAP